MQGWLWSGVAACVAIAVVSGFAERRRATRHDLDRVGLIAWPAVQFAALMGAILCASVAISG